MSSFKEIYDKAIKDDWGYHVVKGWGFKCLDCNQKWFNTNYNWRP